jgi:nucleotide-binding universal stress UspA family protein
MVKGTEEVAAMTAPAFVTDLHDPAFGVERIVVGVDGSPESLAALGWAARQARATGALLEAVTVFQPVADVTFAFGGYPAVNPVDRDQARVVAEESLDKALNSVAPDVTVESIVVADGSPSRTLTDLAQGASMLVVGAHHRSGLGLLLGSTAGSCVRHATCPVVVVPVPIDG